jgi:hypothetical protein
MKRLKFLVGAVALFAVVAVNVWDATTTLTGSELRVADVEAMANPEGNPPLIPNVTFWRVWGYERDDRSGWQKKECERGEYYYDERCIEGDTYFISWGPGGCPFELTKRFWCYGTN